MSERKNDIEFGVMSLEEMLPAKRFGREVIVGTIEWRDFIAKVHALGANEGYAFKGVPKGRVQGYKRRVEDYIKQHTLKLKTRVVTREDGKKDLYVYDNQLDLG